MEIVKELNNNSLIVKLKGRLDTVTAPDLESELNLDNIESLVFDFKDLEYVSSAGLRVILKTYKIMANKSFILKNVKDEIKELFEITGFSDFLTIE